ncbi:MAG: hypothetical protein L3J05_00105 [Robiginitomaculum sp.]|nr:hypothetical protein [Robiginitomaculum sp.]
MTSLANCNRIISELMLLIKTDIKQLRGGDYQEVHIRSRLKAEKTAMLETYLSAFARDVNYPAAKTMITNQLARLNALSLENGRLLMAMSNGIKSARERIRRLQNIPAQVGAYGQNGRALTFMEDPATSEDKF